MVGPASSLLRETAPVDGLRVCEDVAPAAWIAPRLGGGFGAVGRVVPRGYGAYARICHPAEDRDGEPVSWPAVAAACGRRAHALMQWHALVGSAETVHMAGSLWRGRDPQRGNLEPETLGELCGLLGAHTTTTSDCFFCVWEGYGWVENTWRPPSFMQAARERGLGFSAQELARPRVELPGRNYLLAAGALRAALAIASPGRGRQSPNLFWPADRAWCAATELDFDSTLIGGTRELIEAILAAPGLDAWRLEPDDSLAADEDVINAVS